MIDSSGRITLYCNRSEMGQGTYQSLPQILAEELEVSLAQVHIQFAPASAQEFGPQPTEGSFSIRGWAQQLLQVGATARHMLIEAAAQQWQVSADMCYASTGQVIHRSSGRASSYGALAEAAARLQPPAQVKLKDRKDYRLIGQPLPRKDIPLKTSGAAVFGLDKKLPGMRYAVVERNPRFRGKVKRFHDTATRAMPGVTHVFTVQRAVFGDLYEGVAVVADTLWAAQQGRKALQVEWDDTGFEHLDSEQLTARMHEDLAKVPPSASFSEALAHTSKKLEALYETPYQSHSCMEPLNCIAHVQEDRIEIWGPIQEANWIQADLSERMGVPRDKVVVNMTFLGGGFGRKAFPDYPHEAALISQTIKAPVQVVWSREDDMMLGPFRPGATYHCRGGLNETGRIAALQVITATQMMGQTWGASPLPAPATHNSGSLDGLLPAYLEAIPHFSFGVAPTRSPIPVMWWRSVSASTNAFASECFIDELAVAAGQDPLAFRRNHLGDTRYGTLADQLAMLSGWKQRGKKEGWGVAITECFTGIVGHVVKVSRRADGPIKIDKVVALIDCGWYVNPDIIRAQVEGAIVMALGAAVTHETRFKDGKAVPQNFNTYKMPRIADIPAIEVHIAENNEKPGGVGEPGLPPFAPALCNAIFDLTGKRIRKLPFSMEEF